MDWHIATMDEAALLQEISVNNSILANNYGAVNSIIYAKKYGAQIALQDGWLYERFITDGHTAFAFPHATSGDSTGVAEALTLLAAEAKREGRNLSFFNITDKEKKCLCQQFPTAQVEALPNMGDYLYLTEKLSELPGKKYSRKRNHIHQFTKAHPDCTVEALGPDNLDAARHIEDGWLQESGGDAALEEERRIIGAALEGFTSFSRDCGMTGAIAYEGGVPFAFCIASILSPSVTDIHFEKCLSTFARDGGYAFINCEFAKKVKTEYINREEDLGIEGLRKAKLSYFPHSILEKFNATIDSKLL